MATYPGAGQMAAQQFPGAQPPYGTSSYEPPRPTFPTSSYSAPQNLYGPPRTFNSAPPPSYNSPPPSPSMNNYRNIENVPPSIPQVPVAVPVPNGPKKYSSVIFFDNSQKHIDQIAAAGISSQVTAVKVPSAAVASEVSFEHIPYSDENLYVDLAKSQGFSGDKYDSTSGISVGADGEEARQFDLWLEKTAGQVNRAAVFDWDRTISKSERLLIAKDPSFWTQVLELIPDYTSDMLTYLLGGPERIQEIRSFMQRVAAAGVDIVFMSNNGGCSNMEPIIKELMGSTPFTSYCSRDPSYGSDKGKMIQDKLLVSAGGRRKRRSTRRRIHRRVSRRRSNRRSRN